MPGAGRRTNVCLSLTHLLAMLAFGRGSSILVAGMPVTVHGGTITLEWVPGRVACADDFVGFQHHGNKVKELRAGRSTSTVQLGNRSFACALPRSGRPWQQKGRSILGGIRLRSGGDHDARG